jgi:hypothetical protein
MPPKKPEPKALGDLSKGIIQRANDPLLSPDNLSVKPRCPLGALEVQMTMARPVKCLSALVVMMQTSNHIAYKLV